MSVTIKVNGASNSLVHKGSMGFAKSTAPDVCKTPTPTGPIPVPYPIIFSFSSDLKNGTKTVKADGGNMIAVKGSEFSRCTGDEPGTAGGVVSNTNMKEAKWLLFSFDVKMDGKNACRLSDKMTMNHGNTFCLQGVIQLPLFLPPSDDKCAKIYKVIYDLIFTIRPPTPRGGFPKGYQGLMERWRQYAQNVGTKGRRLDGSLGKFAYNHIKHYKPDQERLKKAIEDWDTNNCNDKGGDLRPLRAREYAKHEPELGPGKPLQPAPDPSLYPITISGKDVAKAAAGIGAAGVAIIIITRIIRCFPPLLPLQLSPI
jgi:hypothetical protein